MTQWTKHVTEYVAFLTAIGRPKTTCNLRRFQLTYLGKSLNLPLTSVSQDDLIEWFAIHAEWKPETRRSYRAAIRGFFAWAKESGRIIDDPAIKLPQVKVPRAAARPTPEAVLREAIAAAEPRVALMLRLAAEAGLRRAEIARVHTRDLRHGAGGSQLLVHGKGSRQRVVPITAELAAAIAAGGGGHTPGRGDGGWLFPSQRGGHISPYYVGILATRALPDDWTLHTARHLFASKAYRGTRNLRAVQELLGHSSLSITERYCAVDDDEMRAAMMAAVA
jgi:integrase/recombinase XerC